MSSPLGTPVDRVDGLAKVTGAAKYSADRSFDGLAYGYVVTSTSANGSITAMDVAEARRSPGVLGVYTPFDPLRIIGTATNNSGADAPLQTKDVHHYGEPIGLVVAGTFEQARAAANTVRVSYDRRPPAMSLRAGLPAAVEPPTGDEPAVVTVLRPGVPSIEAALDSSEVVVRATYTTPTHNHMAMEPHSAVASWSDDMLTIYTANQGSSILIPQLAAAMGIPAEKVHAIFPFTGGAFGGKFNTYGHVTLAAAAARKLNRPVKVVFTREQVFSATSTRPETVQNIALGARADGTLTALRHDAWGTTSIARPFVELSSHRTSRRWYATQNLEISQRVVSLNIPGTSIMRAPGEATGSFALESAMDELAAKLGMDPIQLRLKNYACTIPGGTLPWSSKHLDECYRIGAQQFGWDQRPRQPRATRNGNWLIGTGMASAAYPAFRFPATMKVAYLNDGTAEVSGSASDLGTGMTTVLALVGADRLGLPLQRVRPVLGDSQLSQAGFVGGSCGTASVGPAIMAAAQAATRQLLRLAVTHAKSPFHGAPIEEVRYESGEVRRGRQTVPFEALLRMTGSPRIEGEATVAPGNEAQRYEMDCFGANFCEVRVHELTGEIRVSRMLGVMDAGRIVNPKTARNQIIGGMVWGVSAALHEGLHYEESGRIANGTLADYLVPVNADIPDVDVRFVEYPDLIHNPLGAKGVGELGIVGMAAAVANAVYHATGKRVRDLPITLEQMLD